jgi:hypothetical protein
MLVLRKCFVEKCRKKDTICGRAMVQRRVVRGNSFSVRYIHFGAVPRHFDVGGVDEFDSVLPPQLPNLYVCLVWASPRLAGRNGIKKPRSREDQASEPTN